MPDKSIDNGSVLTFRRRGERLFCDWAYAWSTHIQKKSLTLAEVTVICTVIQQAYNDIVRRNPTIQEWAKDFLFFTSFSSSRIQVYKTIRDRRIESDTKFNGIKPWWLWFHLAERNEQKALETFSYDTGKAFMVVSQIPGMLFKDADWTNSATIDNFVSQLANPLKTKYFWQFWKR